MLLCSPPLKHSGGAEELIFLVVFLHICPWVLVEQAQENVPAETASLGGPVLLLSRMPGRKIPEVRRTFSLSDYLNDRLAKAYLLRSRFQWVQWVLLPSGIAGLYDRGWCRNIFFPPAQTNCFLKCSFQSPAKQLPLLCIKSSQGEGREGGGGNATLVSLN